MCVFVCLCVVHVCEHMAMQIYVHMCRGLSKTLNVFVNCFPQNRISTDLEAHCLGYDVWSVSSRDPHN